jgi:N-acetylneuraminic acid mutarotase
MNGVGKLGNKLYVTGGRQCCGEDDRIFNTTWAYEPSTDRLFRRANLPRATTSGITGVIDGKLYVLAGFCSGDPADPGACTMEGPVRQFYRYDPATNTWINRRQPPNFHNGGAGVVINGKFYVVGDCCMEGQRTPLDVYDPVTNTWTTRSGLPFEPSRLSGPQQLSAAVIQNKMFVLQSGIISEEHRVLAYLYDPVTNDWKIRPRPPVFGDIVRVQLDGQARLFLPGNPSSYMYAP